MKNETKKLILNLIRKELNANQNYYVEPNEDIVEVTINIRYENSTTRIKIFSEEEEKKCNG